MSDYDYETKKRIIIEEAEKLLAKYRFENADQLISCAIQVVCSHYGILLTVDEHRRIYKEVEEPLEKNWDKVMEEWWKRYGSHCST